MERKGIKWGRGKDEREDITVIRLCIEKGRRDGYTSRIIKDLL